MTLADAPLELRAEAALLLIGGGADPLATLAAALWPSARAQGGGELITGFCKRGHPWNEENTRIRKDGHRLCRACQRLSYERRDRSREVRRERHAVCAYCGGQATPTKNGENPRCRSCYFVHLKEGRRKVR